MSSESQPAGPEPVPAAARDRHDDDESSREPERYRASTPERQAKLDAWDRRAAPFLIVSAVLPLLSAFFPTHDTAVREVLGVLCWAVFVVDLVVHVRLVPHYLKTGRGMFDLGVVIVTAPWYLYTGSVSQFVNIARLARVARLIVASSRSGRVRHLVNQLGGVALYAFALIAVCSLVVKWVEPASSGFTTYGDALWWGFVTFTTVGYGDLVPVTGAGRTTAVFLMFGGVAFLGTLAGTLSAFFGVGDDGKPLQVDDEGNEIEGAERPQSQPGPTPRSAEEVVDEIVALRDRLDSLLAELARSR